MSIKIRPLVFKVNEPEEFVMNASNANISGNYEYWESPTYPDVYNGNGKTAIVTISAPLTNSTNMPLFYSQTITVGGPVALTIPLNPEVGTYTFTLADNAGASEGFGKYFVLLFSSVSAREADASKIDIRIINP